MKPVASCTRLGATVLDNDSKPSCDQAGSKNAYVVQGVKCNSWWLDRSLIVDFRENLNVISFFSLAMAAWDYISNIRELSPS